MALFGGAYLPRRALAFAAPLGALLLSDLVLGFYPGMDFVYLSVALTVLIGWAIARRKSALHDRRRGGRRARSCSSSLTNFGMWLMSGYLPEDAGRPRRLLRRGDPVLPEHACRRPVLRGLAVRRLRACRAGDPEASRAAAAAA